MVGLQFQATVDILGESIEVRVYRRLVPRTTPWLAIGECWGRSIQSQGSTAEAAIEQWEAAAQRHGESLSDSPVTDSAHVA